MWFQKVMSTVYPPFPWKVIGNSKSNNIFIGRVMNICIFWNNTMKNTRCTMSGWKPNFIFHYTIFNLKIMKPISKGSNFVKHLAVVSVNAKVCANALESTKIYLITIHSPNWCNQSHSQTTLFTICYSFCSLGSFCLLFNNFLLFLNFLEPTM